MLYPEIIMHNYKILSCDRSRQEGGAECYVRNNLNYNILSAWNYTYFGWNSKQKWVGTIYRPPNQSDFLEVINNNMNKLNQ